MASSRTPKGDVVAGVLLAALGVYITTTATSWPILDAQGPGPGFFPIFYGVAMIAGSLLLIVFAFMGRSEADAEPVDWAGMGRALASWGSLVVMIPILKYFGFAIAFAALILFFGRVIFQSSWRLTIVSAVLIPLGFLVLFPTLLKVQLPVGIWTGF